MKKHLFTCFLALLCLAGSLPVLSQVVQSPGADFLHRSGPTVSPHSGDTHRGGETLSDTFLEYNGPEVSIPPLHGSGPWTFDRGLKDETAASDTKSLDSCFLCLESSESLVDQHLDPGAGEETIRLQPAPVTVFAHQLLKDQKNIPETSDTESLESCVLGLASTSVLIYGELINPDSLAPLLLVTTPYYLDPNSSYLRSEQEIVPQPGEFFDGVLNPMVQKFSAELPLSGRPGYFDLYLQERPLLHNYLIYPGDSIKLSLDLMRMQVLFAGTNAAFYEAQYELKRQQKKVEFDAPRQLVTPKSSKMLQREESQAKIEKFKDGFGARLLILDPGKESLDYLLQGLENPSTLNAQLEVLDGFAEKLSPEQYSLLRTETICGFYSSGLASYRKFHHPYVESLAEEQRNGYRTRVRNLIQTVSGQDFGLDDQLVSAGFLNLGLEISILDAIWKEKSFLASVDEAFSGEVADRIRAGYLSNYLSALPEQENYINKFLKQTTTAPWRERILSLERSHIPGDTILPVTLYDMEGETYGREDLAGRPTLLYFYFSTCSHSASFFKNYLFPLYRETEALGYRLIAISVDRDPSLWRSRIESYSDPAILNLNLRGEDKERWRSYYEMYAYPQTMFLDASGRIVSFDIRDLGKNYESLEKGFMELYREKITNQTPFSEPYL